MKIYIFVLYIFFVKIETMDRLEEIVTVEIKGISKTIYDYTNDTFIRSYAEELKSIVLPKDRVKLDLLVTRLLEWYEITFNEIKQDKYIYNIDSHIKSYECLREMKKILSK